MEKKSNVCTRCNRSLDDKNIVWLELSITDGRYYKDVPFNHESQGCFPFGKICAYKELELKEEV